MKLKSIIVFILLSICSYSQTTFETKKVEKIITKFNHQINDEYAWLENTEAEEVKKWVSIQNAYTLGYHSGVKKSISTKETIKIYDKNSSGSLPNHKGKYFYKYLVKERDKSPSLFITSSIEEKPIEIIDPNKIYP